MAVQQTALEWVQLGFAKAILVDVLGVEEDRIAPEAMLVTDLGADSLDLVEIQCILEDKGVSAPDEVFTNIMQVKDLAALFVPEAA